MSTSCGYHRFHFRWEIPYWVSQWSRTIIRILCALKHWIQTTDCEDEVKPAMSAEPGWWKPYADDLQWRIVYQHLAQGLSYQAIARNLSIATSTVQWLYALFETTDVQPLDPWKGNKTQTGKKKKTIWSHWAVHYRNGYGKLIPLPRRSLPAVAGSIGNFYFASHSLQTTQGLWHYSQEDQANCNAEMWSLAWSLLSTLFSLVPINLSLLLSQAQMLEIICSSLVMLWEEWVQHAIDFFLEVKEWIASLLFLLLAYLLLKSPVTPSMEILLWFCQGISNTSNEAIRWSQPKINRSDGQPLRPSCWGDCWSFSTIWNYSIFARLQPRPESNWGSF